MKHSELLLIVFVSIWIFSCEKSNDQYFYFSNNHDAQYWNVCEITLPTNSPLGLAFDGMYLWYSDDALNCLNKISDEGKILKTIRMPGCRLTDFDFSNGYIWCINDTTVGHETVTEAHYPLSCIYKLSLAGKKLDSILLGHPESKRPIFLGMTIIDSTIYFSTNQGYSSALRNIDSESKQVRILHYCLLAGLTAKKDTIYVIDIQHASRTRIAPIDKDYNIIEDKAIEISFRATDLVFINNDLWVCDRKERKLKKIK